MKRLALFVGCVAAIAVIAAEIPKAIWNFDGDKAGALPKGLTNEEGNWRIIADDTAPSKPNALAQTAESPDANYNLTLIGKATYRDVDISVRMKSVAGKADQGGGIVWRAQDKKNYYVARYNPLESNYRVYKVEKGKRTQFRSANIPGSDGWHELRIVMKGDQIECYYDKRKYLDVKDTTFKVAGKIGLWTKADARTRFDDVTASVP